MKLTSRLISLIIVTLSVLLVADGVMETVQERTAVRRDMSEDALLTGHALSGPLRDRWAREGRDSVVRLLREISAERASFEIRWVSLAPAAAPAVRPRAALDAILPLSPSRGRSLSLPEAGGPGRLCTYVPLEAADGEPGALEISESLADLARRTAKRIRRVLLLLAALAASGAVTVFVLGVSMVGRPLEKLDAKARRIGAGDFSGPLRLPGRGELSVLADALNDMCERIVEARERAERETAQRMEALDQLRHADRLRTVGRMSSGVAHELGTPLNVVTGRASLILRGTLPPEQVEESARIIKEQGERMTQIIQKLLDFSRRRTTEKGPLDVARVVAAACELVAPLARKQNVRVRASLGEPEPFRARGNAAELQQVLVNLLMNAVQSMEGAPPGKGGGEATVEVSRARTHDPKRMLGGDPLPWVRVRVRDRGVGIPEDDLQRVFEPFFTTKDVGRGLGLGLSIVFGILQDHGGWIEVESTVGEGTTFTFYLPEEGGS